MLQVAHGTVTNWLTVLEHLYICYRINPFVGRITRSLTKEQKLYLFDPTTIANPGARFENMVANHLWKAVQYWTDMGFGEFQLQYWRNKEKQEVDFIVTQNLKPLFAVECKLTDRQPSSSLLELGKHYSIPLFQLVGDQNPPEQFRQVRVGPAAHFLANLP